MTSQKIRLSRRTLLAGAVLTTGTAALAVSRPIQAAQSSLLMNKQIYGPSPGIAKLNANENPYGPSPEALKAMSQAIQKGAYYANDSAERLKTMIAERHELTKDHIMITSGSSGALTYLAMAASEKGHILGPDLFWDTTSKMGARNSSFGIKHLAKTKDLSIDLTKMYNSITPETALVQITNPNNPTGLTLEASALKTFCLKASEKTMVLVDEAYNELSDDPDANNMIPLIKEGKNIAVARTFSKIYGLAGLRIGYMIARPETIQMASKFSLGDYSLNIAGLAAAISSYNDFTFLKYSKTKILEGRQMLTDALEANGLAALPTQTNFMFVDLGSIDAEKFRAAMFEEGVMIRGIYRDYNNWSRVSMGKLPDIQKYIDALPKVLDQFS